MEKDLEKISKNLNSQEQPIELQEGAPNIEGLKENKHKETNKNQEANKNSEVNDDLTMKPPFNQENGLHKSGQRNKKKCQTVINTQTYKQVLSSGNIPSTYQKCQSPLEIQSTKKVLDNQKNHDELFTILNQDEASQKTEQNSQEEDKKVLIIYAGGFFGAEYDFSKGSSPLFLTKNYLYEKMQKISYFCDINFTYQHATEGFLVTPLSEYKKRIYYKVVEMENIKINSTFFDKNSIEELLDIIDQNYKLFDSFVIIHGTDSLAYTASFVSFMIENLSKPIIFTGSMVPLSIMRNDSFNNLLGALTIAGHFNIPEVCIFFHNKLLRGNRSTKIDAQGLDCFMSPNLPNLAEFKVHIEVNWPIILRNDEYEQVQVKNLSLIILFKVIINYIITLDGSFKELI